MQPRPTSRDRAPALFSAADTLTRVLARGEALATDVLRDALVHAFGDTDANGAWNWRDAYEAAEAAVVLFLHRFAAPMRRKADTPEKMMAMLGRLAALEPSQTRRSEEQIARQQFSTPLSLAYAAMRAARLRRNDSVLEPSAGTGMLAIFPDAAGVPVHLNELAKTRADLLQKLFPNRPVTHHNAERIHDFMPHLRPTVVIMNPPFSRAAHIDQKRLHIDLAHLASAYATLTPGGRLVAITGHNTTPCGDRWDDAFRRLPQPIVRFTTTIDGQLYQRRGTTFTTRLTVIDRPGAEPHRLQPYPEHHAKTPAELIEIVESTATERLKLDPITLDLFADPSAPERPAIRTRPRRAPAAPPAPRADFGDIVELDYSPAASLSVGAPSPGATSPFDPWLPECITVEGAQQHPSALVQTAAMAAIRSPLPSWRPLLPAATISSGLLSDAQLETIVLTGEAHSRHLATEYEINEEWDHAEPVAAGSSETAVRLRRGYMLGDGTGAAKGRQAAGILLDNWLRGRRRLVWFSFSAKLIKDARRDWIALGGHPDQIIELGKIRQSKPIPHETGILFVTYATLRTGPRAGKQSRLHQIIEWLAGSLDLEHRHAYDGCIVLDEAHALSNAIATRGSRGLVAPSQQGLAGMRLQNALPDARILYVSATGASKIEALAYATRLGLWGTADTSFANRTDFITSMNAGGIAALEVVARDLKSLGRYQSRSLSFAGVEVDILQHDLTDTQRVIYDEYADAFAIIHNHLDEALEAAGVTDDGTTLNRQAKAAARSAFESTKQRFFGHLLNSMKCPSLIRHLRQDLDEGHAAVIQLISTGEALLDRRIAEIPTSEWNDLSIDLTPREYVLSYLEHAFPTALYEHYTDKQGHLHARLVTDENGRPIECQEALALRQALIERLAALPPIPSALDQIVQTLGHDNVAEITGRTRRVLRIDGCLALRKRPGSANITEETAFMNDEKRVLVFSVAGGTGRSYHADRSATNQRRRIHYLLEPGWRADIAIQGLGRTHRTNQAQPPVFRPVATNVKGERRFIATIAKRLDALGAITRGQRDAQTQGMFRDEDNLESPYAHAALRQLYRAIHANKIGRWSLQRLETLTGLSLTTDEGALKETLPPMSQFLNRILALRIDDQNSIFTELETRIDANIADAKEAGSYNIGLETLTGEHIDIVNREAVQTDDETGATTDLVEIFRRERIVPLTLEKVLRRYDEHGPTGASLAINQRSRHAALVVPAPGRILEDGGILPRYRLIRPARLESLDQHELRASNWNEASLDPWKHAWTDELAALPEHKESTLWLVAGLLLPIWHLLPNDEVRIRRLTTNDGERLLGRILSEAEAVVFRRTLGLGSTTMSAEEVKTAVLELGSSFHLVNGWRLTRRRLMSANRIEIEGPVHTDITALKTLGCHTEIVSYRLRVFVPVDGLDTLHALLERCPVDTATRQTA